MSLSRRRFLATATVAAASGAAGCSIPEDETTRIATACARPPGAHLRIDMHCHLMNQKDGNPAAFINRHYFDADERAPILSFAAGVLGNTAGALLGTTTLTAAAERRILARAGPMAPDPFCRHATAQQKRIFTGNPGPDWERLTGFASNRTRNASLLMAMWPEIDIFLPSMVDLYEGKPRFGTPPHRLTPFYETLNIASRGRFLPMVSFHPERQWHEDPYLSTRGTGPLAVVRRALETQGFVGIKVHPSAGFDPWFNTTKACNNAAIALGGLPHDQRAFYDRAMRALYALAVEFDVPVLTHGSDGLPAKADCMHRPADQPKGWTNAPGHWIEALDATPGLRVILAHFASRFENQRTPDFEAVPVQYNTDGTLRPSDWLADAVSAIEGGQDRLSLDLSFMPYLYRSQADREQGARLFYDGGRYAAAFGAFLQAHPRLGRQMLYGSDWHMPQIVDVGRPYMGAIERTLPDSMRAGVMGTNAARVFGLRRGDTTRWRLERFYARAGLSLEQIPWIARVDSLA